MPLIFPGGTTEWYYHGGKSKKNCKNTKTVVKAKYLYYLCHQFYILINTCKTWKTLIYGYEDGKWFNVMVYNLYLIAFGSCKLHILNW